MHIHNTEWVRGVLLSLANHSNLLESERCNFQLSFHFLSFFLFFVFLYEFYSLPISGCVCVCWGRWQNFPPSMPNNAQRWQMEFILFRHCLCVCLQTSVHYFSFFEFPSREVSSFDRRREKEGWGRWDWGWQNSCKLNATSGRICCLSHLYRAVKLKWTGSSPENVLWFSFIMQLMRTVRGLSPNTCTHVGMSSLYSIGRRVEMERVRDKYIVMCWHEIRIKFDASRFSARRQITHESWCENIHHFNN